VGKDKSLPKRGNKAEERVLEFLNQDEYSWVLSNCDIIIHYGIL